jgi:hypothetical protein
VSWDQTFFDPIVLPSGKKLITLRDAAHYITKLPKAEHDAEEWQAAMLFARIGVMKALNRNIERTLTDRKKCTGESGS